MGQEGFVPCHGTWEKGKEESSKLTGKKKSKLLHLSNTGDGRKKKKKTDGKGHSIISRSWKKGNRRPSRPRLWNEGKKNVSLPRLTPGIISTRDGVEKIEGREGKLLL